MERTIPGTPYLSLAGITFRPVNKVQSPMSNVQCPRAERKVKVKVKEEGREEDRSKVQGREFR
jgi:hypothetical protein